MISASDMGVAPVVGPPKTAVQPVEETLHGHLIVDKYRWLEDGTSAQTKAWVADELAYTRRILDPLPGRADIEKRLTQLLSVGSINAPQIAGTSFFYTKREGMQNQPNNCFVILTYRSIASASCCFSMYSPSVCAT